MVKQEILSKRIVRISVWGALINLLLIYLVIGVFDMVSSLIYLVVTILITNIFFFNKKVDNTNSFVLGVSYNLGYNLLGIIVGWFSFLPIHMLLAATQQGLITVILSKVIKR